MCDAVLLQLEVRQGRRNLRKLMGQLSWITRKETEEYCLEDSGMPGLKPAIGLPPPHVNPSPHLDMDTHAHAHTQPCCLLLASHVSRAWFPKPMSLACITLGITVPVAMFYTFLPHSSLLKLLVYYEKAKGLNMSGDGSSCPPPQGMS